MNTEGNVAAELQELKTQQRVLDRAVRVALALIVITLATAAARAALQLPAMADLYRDMLPGQALPIFTRLILDNAMPFLVTAVLMAALGLGALCFSQRPGRGILPAAIVIVALFVQWQVMVTASQSPLMQVMQQVGEPVSEKNP